ncbi:MAG TPA: hypothetical protein VNV36_07750 [Pseudomonas sp.]|nr:hypothetical protein [Pseudomonas sp.]HWH86655.1 hypothetical protein [Pseudomonas sp.]
MWNGITARIEPQVLHLPEKRPFWNWLRITAALCSIVVPVFFGSLDNRDDARYTATLLNADAQPALKVEAHADYMQVEPLTPAAVDSDRSRLDPCFIRGLWPHSDQIMHQKSVSYRERI